MPDIRPFRGWRYDLGRVGALSDVVAPPYDVIDSALQHALYAKHPHNVIRVDLNREEPDDDGKHNRYTRAARFFKDWQQDSILRQENDPALYVYHQTFTVEGKEYTRRGVLARVRLEPFGKGCIYPHEETMPGPKADRLLLMHATAMNLSPIFGLYPDPLQRVQERLDAAVQRMLPVEAVDHLGTISRLWPVTDLHVIRDVQSLLHAMPVFIADGHHRYETSLKYLDERRAAGEVRDDEAPPNFVLMMLVGMNDPGLRILPTHRLISGVPELTADRLRALLNPHFETETVGTGSAAVRHTWELIEAAGEQDLLGFCTVADKTWQTARFRGSNLMAKLARDHSPAWQGLGVSILHVVVLNQLLREGLKAEPTCQYVHLLGEVTTAVAAKQCKVAVLVPPATMQHVQEIAGNHEKMPPKSTYFYPKLLTGLVFNPLK